MAPNSRTDTWLSSRLTIDAQDVNPADDEPHWAKYSGAAAQFGLTEAMASYRTRIKISIDKVWTTVLADGFATGSPAFR